jgi:hypothetical protein
MNLRVEAFSDLERCEEDASRTVGAIDGSEDDRVH